jgi:hypothetical protein
MEGDTVEHKKSYKVTDKDEISASQKHTAISS